MEPVRSELVLQFIASGLAVAENRRKQTATDRLSPVDRNDRATSVGMLQEVVAALRPRGHRTHLRGSPNRGDHHTGPRVVQVLRGFADGSFCTVDVAGASAEQAGAFAKTLRYGASVDTTVWRAEWAVPLAELGVAPGTKAVVPFDLTVDRIEDDVFAQYAGTLGETWDLQRGGRLQLE